MKYLLEEIATEHEEVTAIIAFNKTINEAKALDTSKSEDSEQLAAFNAALERAQSVLSSEEPTLEEITEADNTLKVLYLALTNTEEIKGTAVIEVEKNDDGRLLLEKARR